MATKKLQKKNIEEGVKDIICDICDVKRDKLNSNTSLRNELGIDSIDVAEIIFAVNQKFNIDITNAKVETIDTIGTLVENLDKKVNS